MKTFKKWMQASKIIKSHFLLHNVLTSNQDSACIYLWALRKCGFLWKILLPKEDICSHPLGVFAGIMSYNNLWPSLFLQKKKEKLKSYNF